MNLHDVYTISAIPTASLYAADRRKYPHSRYELARGKEREDEAAFRKDEDKRRIIIEEERRRLQRPSKPLEFARGDFPRLLREYGRELKKFLPDTEIAACCSLLGLCRKSLHRLALGLGAGYQK